MNQNIRLFLGVLVLGLLFSCARTPQQVIENISESQKYRNSIVRVENGYEFFPKDIGSGFFVERNKVATNIHVIARPGSVYVKSVDRKTTWKVEGVAAYDVRNDLAILKVVGSGKALPLGNSDIVQAGERISVVGYPDGKYEVAEGTLHGIRNNDKWFQMAVDTTGGSSGSPVLNSKGQVIGIDTTGDAFYSYAIPSNILKVLLTQSASTQSLEQWHRRELIRSYHHYNQGTKNYDKKRYDKAIADLDEAIRLNPEYIDAYFKRARARSFLGDHEGAISDYDKNIKLNPEDAIAYYNRGNGKYYLGDYKGAISDYDKVLDLNPEDVDAYNNRAIARLQYGISESKQENTKKALDLFEAAIADFNKKLEINSKDAIAYRNRGAAKIKLGEFEVARGNVEKAQILYETAIADSTQSIRLNPADDGAYHNRGMAKKILGDSKSEQGDQENARRLYEAAIVDLDKAIQLNPRSTRFYRNRARAKEALGQHDAAKADFEKAEELDTDIGK